MTQSLPPPPITNSGGTGKFLVLGLLLLLVGGGLIYKGMNPGTTSTAAPPPPPVAVVDAATPPAPTGPTVGVAFALTEVDAGPDVAVVAEPEDAGLRRPQPRIVYRQQCPGEVDTRAVGVVLQQNYSGLRECYNRALRTNPVLAGNVVASWLINANGTVGDMATGGAASRDADFRTCFQGALRRMRFAPPRGGCAQFQQTFRFSANN